MPIYEYRCQECGKTFEARQSFSAEPYRRCGEAANAACERQGEGSVERLLSSPAFVFKGSGFYITDYTKNGGDKAKSASGEGKSGSKAETKSDTKSDTKSEAKPAAPASAKSD